MIVKFKKLDNRAVIPEYATEQAAGFDVRAVLDEPVTLQCLERKLFNAGFAIELPVGYEAQVRPRSGLALKHGLSIVNAPGTIDADYRGPVGVILVNLSNEPYTIQPNERIAQIVIAKHEHADLVEVSELNDTERGAGGFGSTGK